MVMEFFGCIIFLRKFLRDQANYTNRGVHVLIYPEQGGSIIKMVPLIHTII